MAYKEDISVYVEMVELVKQVQYQLKHDGLNVNSVETFEKTSIENESLTPLGMVLKDKIVEYIRNESEPIVNGQFLPSSSDIIESLFGKYKMFLKTRPLNELSKMLLMLPLFVTNITNDLIKKAMESVRYIDVEKWSYELFGLSSLAKRKLAATSNMDIKTA